MEKRPSVRLNLLEPRMQSRESRKIQAFRTAFDGVKAEGTLAIVDESRPGPAHSYDDALAAHERALAPLLASVQVRGISPSDLSGSMRTEARARLGIPADKKG